MYQDNKIWIGTSGEEKVYIYPKMANRHGLIAGATGTGKTVTLKVMAESFSDCGVPVFLADVKGDLAAMCKAGVENDNVNKRVESMKLNEFGYEFKAYPTNYWDAFTVTFSPVEGWVKVSSPAWSICPSKRRG